MHFLTVTAPSSLDSRYIKLHAFVTGSRQFLFFFTYILDDPQINPVHRITSTWRYTETFKHLHILPLRYKLPAHSTPAGANRCQMSVERLQPNITGPQTKLDWHLHTSQQRQSGTYSDQLISNKSTKSTSSKPTAIERATPVERKGLFPWVTGHGSLCSSPSRSVKFMSILCTGCRNLQKLK